MFAMGAATRIYVATGATDMRKGFCGLEGPIRVTTRKRLFLILFAVVNQHRIGLISVIAKLPSCVQAEF